MRTIVYVAHPNVLQSDSQQFLIQSGQSLTDVTYVDLQSEFNLVGKWNVEEERKRLKQYERVILQFPLYWYQAPSILKDWIDHVIIWDNSLHIEFGIVVIAGVSASDYQAGAREGRTLSELLSPYEAMARSLKWRYLPHFAVHQFQYMSEEEKMDLMMRYACYLNSGKIESFNAMQQFILEKLEALTNRNIRWNEEEEQMFQLFIHELCDQQTELSELIAITRGW